MNEDIFNQEIEILLGNLPDLLYKRLYYKDKESDMFEHFDSEVKKTTHRLDLLFLYKSFDYLNKK